MGAVTDLNAVRKGAAGTDRDIVSEKAIACDDRAMADLATLLDLDVVREIGKVADPRTCANRRGLAKYRGGNHGVAKHLDVVFYPHAASVGQIHHGSTDDHALQSHRAQYGARVHDYILAELHTGVHDCVRVDPAPPPDAHVGWVYPGPWMYLCRGMNFARLGAPIKFRLEGEMIVKIKKGSPRIAAFRERIRTVQALGESRCRDHRGKPIQRTNPFEKPFILEKYEHRRLRYGDQA